MSDLLIREYGPEDVAEIKSLWREVFHDPEALIDSFFELLPDMGTALTARLGGQLAGFACVIVGMELIDGEKRKPVVGYIYSTAVDERFRGRGIGGRLVKAAAEKARDREASLICVLPEEPSLYGWYSSRLGLDCALFRQRLRVESRAAEPVMGLSSTEYMLWRENMLRAVPHLHPSSFTLEFARRFFESLGGGLYACGSGICAAYMEDGAAIISELISMDQGEIPNIAASIGAQLGASHAVYFIPAAQGEPYIAARPGLIPPDAVWNLSFD